MSIPSSKDRSILPDEMIEATRQPTNMTIPPELFEQLYLAPKTKVKGHLRETFGNPTPIALGGFILTTTPVSMALLGWQGAGGFLAGANAGVFFWLGGIMTLLGAIGEWILGNTFPATVFFTFSCFWLTLSATISPDFNAIGLYSTTTNPVDGLAQPQFYSTFSFFLVAMAMVCVVFMVASLRTNIFFFLMFALLVACLSCLSASFFAVANGRSSALGFQHAGAAILLAVSFLGWYFFTALVLLSVDFPIVLPIGDLSTVIKGRSARVEQEEAQKNGENGSSG